MKTYFFSLFSLFVYTLSYQLLDIILFIVMSEMTRMQFRNAKSMETVGLFPGGRGFRL